MALQADRAAGNADMDSLAKCWRALELALTSRGNPLVDVDHILADDPQFVFGHCLRAALIVRADNHTARSSLLRA